MTDDGARRRRREELLLAASGWHSGLPETADRHLDDQGVCTLCRTPFPCPRVRTADPSLLN